jgi:hypothetical protein
MSDPEKLKNNSEEHDRFDSTPPDNKLESSGSKGFKEKMVGKITGTTGNKLDESDISLSESIRICVYGSLYSRYCWSIYIIWSSSVSNPRRV